MAAIIGIVLAFIFVQLCAIHFYWAFEGRWGKNAALPIKPDGTKIIDPTMLDCLVVGFISLGIGFFVLIKCKLVIFPLSAWVMNYGLWVLALAFLLRAMGEFKYIGFFKKVKNGEFAKYDTKYYSPLCVLIAILMVVIQLTT